MALMHTPPMAVNKRHSLYNESDINLSDEDNGQANILVTEASLSALHGYRTYASSEENCQEEEPIMQLNVGGQIFKTYISTLKKLKATKFGYIAQQPYSKTELFFDRNPDVFASILDYCRYNELHIPSKTCVMLFRKELEFWGVNESHISVCCKKRYNESLDEIRLNEALKKEFIYLKPKDKCRAETNKEKIYNILYYPETSVSAKIWATVYYILVIVSVINIFLSTLSQFRVPVSGDSLSPFYADDSDYSNHSISKREITENVQVLNNFTSSNSSNPTSLNSSNSSNPTSSSSLQASEYVLEQLETNHKLRMMVTTRVVPIIQYIDLFCMFYFTADFIARLMTVPKRLHMLGHFFTMCDLMYLIPVWILWIGQLFDETFWRTPGRIPLFLFLQCFIVARVVALFRVANQYRALQILVLSLKASLGEILLLFVFVFFAMVVYASLIYCVEIFIVESMDNMFIGLWWSIITMTTVGYGDTYPESGLGYLVACVCALTGIILIGMVVPIITSNFHKYYGFRNIHQDPPSPTKKNPPTTFKHIPSTYFSQDPPIPFTQDSPTPSTKDGPAVPAPSIQTKPTATTITQAMEVET